MYRSDLAKFLGVSVVCMAVCALATGVDAASYAGRSTYGRMTGAASSARMPTMPTLPGMTVGNISQDVPTVPSVPDTPDTPSEPDVPDTPNADCPDGGVKNSGYTIEACMTDMLRCVNGGGLPGGLNDLFDENVRESVAAGMGVCTAQVEKCISDVRVNCKYIYDSAADVWADFNSRRVQPAYYDFVLRKTGLSPYQAEYTCRMLDNNQGGQYAYWDAVNGACMVRVAAFNKDEQIKNSWLFGAAGDDTLAQVWRATGETFTCNKDLFGFSLMNDTNTAAVVGVGGGTLLGAGIGAAVGHGAQGFDCTNAEHRQLLLDTLVQQKVIGGLEDLLEKEVGQDPLSEDLCNSIVKLYNVYLSTNTATKHVVDVETVEGGVSSEGTDEESEVEVSNNEGNVVFFHDVFVPDVVNVLEGKAGNRLKTTAIGAATGAGVGGLATAITAFVEKNNINCRVGDDIHTVSYGKSYTIPTLRDLYLKFGLQLPDVVSSGANIAGCDAWVNACAEYSDLNMCKFAQFNYKSSDGVVAQAVPAACVVSDGVCIENYPVTKSYGVCE